MCSLSFADEPQPADDAEFTSVLDHPKLAERISLDLNDINITDAIRYLGDKAGINVAISKNVGGRVTLSFQDVSIRDAMEITLLSNDLAAERRGEIIYVSTSDDYLNRFGESWGDARQVKMFKLRYARATDVQNILTTIKSKVGNTVVNDESGTVVIMDVPEKIAKMREAISLLDKELLTQVFNLKYAKAKTVEENLKDRIEGKGLGSVKADEHSNTVTVTAPPGRMEEVEIIIAELDKEVRQVLIEAKIVKVSLNPDFSMGVDWDFIARESTRTHATSLAMNMPIPASVASFGSLTFGTLASDDYTGIIKILQTVGETKLLSSPRITAINGKEAKILVGTREAYTTQTVTQGTSTTTTAENVAFIDVGVQLFVTPTINDDDNVTIKIKPEVSSVVRSITTSQGNEIPIIDTTTAETTVMVKDGHTIIIGGLIKDETLRTIRKIPGLGNIPILGHLFKETDEEKEKTELVVFLTPRIIRGDQNMYDWEDKQPKGFRDYDEEIESFSKAEINAELSPVQE